MNIKGVLIGGMMAVAASAMALDCEVTGITAQQRYPWNGLVDIAVTLSGVENDVANADFSFMATNKATNAELSIASLTRNGKPSGSGTSWTQKFIWNAPNDVANEIVADIELSVSAKVLGGVQLWENGPYWAECNVGADQPEDYGYYFWWGDTVGYTRNVNNDGWVSVKNGTAFSFSTGSCPTYGQSISSLQWTGYIDSTLQSEGNESKGNLVAAHDAATAYLGAPWRMPTDAEFAALISNCTATWTNRNGVSGCLVTGMGAYASKSIFLPAAGGGYGSDRGGLGSECTYWSSTTSAISPDDCGAYYLYYFRKLYAFRHYGLSVRPLRGFAQ